MTRVRSSALYWAPRVLSVVFLLFVSLFALDAFDEGRGFWRTVAALAMHLFPVIVLAIVLALAWRWEWIGASLYGAGAALYIVLISQRGVATEVKVANMAVIAGPALVIALLFLWNWIRHAELRERGEQG